MIKNRYFGVDGIAVAISIFGDEFNKAVIDPYFDDRASVFGDGLIGTRPFFWKDS